MNIFDDIVYTQLYNNDKFILEYMNVLKDKFIKLFDEYNEILKMERGIYDDKCIIHIYNNTDNMKHDFNHIFSNIKFEEIFNFVAYFNDVTDYIITKPNFKVCLTEIEIDTYYTYILDRMIIKIFSDLRNKYITKNEIVYVYK